MDAHPWAPLGTGSGWVAPWSFHDFQGAGVVCEGGQLIGLGHTLLWPVQKESCISA